MVPTPILLDASAARVASAPAPSAAAGPRTGDRAGRGARGPALAREAARIVLVAAMAALIWVAHFDRWTAESWHLPTQYSGDAHETLARLQAAAEGDTGLFKSQVIERLGAPFGAHWNAYPTPDKLLMSALGLLVPALGLYFTANLALVLAQISAAVAFYVAARWLRCRWEWACAGGLIFAYTYHTFHRGLAHFSLLFTWTVPLGLLAAWLVAGSHHLAWKSRGAGLCLVAATALGVSNPYNLFFWLQLMAWAVFAQIVGGRQRTNIQIGLAGIALAIGACVVANTERWVHVDDTDARPVLERNYAGTERYALKPVEMFIPPSYHRWDYFASFGRRYVAWSNWRGEGVTPYLGLAGVAGLGWLMIVAARRALSRRSVPPQAMAVAWLLAYASIGGVTNLLAMFAGLQIFRATNRAAIFLSAIAVWWLVAGLSRISGRLPRGVRFAAAAAVAALAIPDQLPQAGRGQIEAARQVVQSDREFGAQLESALGAGAMVFQLPTLEFPEAEPPRGMVDYEHFRPYLATQTLRFSYGSPRQRARGGWQRDLRNAPASSLVPALEASGFAALYLNRKAFEDRGDALLRQLAALGYDRRIDSRDREQVAVLLQPSPQPRLPLGRRLTVGLGWKIRPDDGAPWSYDDGALSFFNPYPNPITVELQLTLTSRRHRRLTLELDGTPLRDVDIPADTTRVVVPSLALAHGVHRFHLRSREAPGERDDAPNEVRAFKLAESVVRPISVLASR